MDAPFWGKKRNEEGKKTYLSSIKQQQLLLLLLLTIAISKHKYWEDVLKSTKKYTYDDLDFVGGFKLLLTNKAKRNTKHYWIWVRYCICPYKC